MLFAFTLQSDSLSAGRVDPEQPGVVALFTERSESAD